MTFVSLGSSCATAHQLKIRNLSTMSYPFDWIRTKCFSDVVYLVENNFIDFDKIEYVGDDIERKFDKNIQRIIVKNKYATFYHDFTDIATMNELYKKYTRRIKRLYDLICSDKCMTFIREELKTSHIDQNYLKLIEEFDKCLRKRNEMICYKLIIIIHNPKCITNEHINALETLPNVQVINHKNKFDGWQCNNIDWDTIFR